MGSRRDRKASGSSRALLIGMSVVSVGPPYRQRNVDIQGKRWWLVVDEPL